MNRVILYGRFCDNPRLQKAKSGQIYTNFNFACPNYVQGTNKEDGSDFFWCMAFGEKAKHICRYCVKGMTTMLIGTINVSSYKDNAGKWTTAWKIVVQDVEFGYNPNYNGKDKIPPAKLEEFADSDDIF